MEVFFSKTFEFYSSFCSHFRMFYSTFASDFDLTGLGAGFVEQLNIFDYVQIFS